MIRKNVNETCFKWNTHKQASCTIFILHNLEKTNYNPSNNGSSIQVHVSFVMWNSLLFTWIFPTSDCYMQWLIWMSSDILNLFWTFLDLIVLLNKDMIDINQLASLLLYSETWNNFIAIQIKREKDNGDRIERSAILEYHPGMKF